MLRVIRCKPNPSGKDTAHPGRATAAQLGAEWCDIQNQGLTRVDFTRFRLYHVAHTSAGPKWEQVVEESARITSILEACSILRVHSGAVRDLSALRAEDMVGANLHAFTGRDWYRWNNVRDDRPAIFEVAHQQFVDESFYRAPVGEGVILVRQGNELVPGIMRRSA